MIEHKDFSTDLMAPISGSGQEKAQEPPPSNGDPSPQPEDTTLGNSITLPDIPPLPKMNPWFIVSVVVIIVLICLLAGLGFIFWRWYTDWSRRPLRRKEAWEVEVFGCGGCGREPSRSVTPESTVRNTLGQEMAQSSKEPATMTFEKELSASESTTGSGSSASVREKYSFERVRESSNDHIYVSSAKAGVPKATVRVSDLPPRLSEPDWNRLTIMNGGLEREMGFDVRSSSRYSGGMGWRDTLQLRPETREEEIETKVVGNVAHFQ